MLGNYLWDRMEECTHLHGSLAATGGAKAARIGKTFKYLILSAMRHYEMISQYQ